MKTKVLIVDDDKVICKITKRMFQISGLPEDPITFNSGDQAFDFLKQQNNKQQNTVIFLDINMPFMDGWEFIDLLEKENMLTNITIYLITSSIFPEDHRRAKENKNVEDIVIKPITLEKTKELVSQISK